MDCNIAELSAFVLAVIPVSASNCKGMDEYGITDCPFEYLMNAAFANLYEWVRSGTPPPRAKVIETVPGSEGTGPEIKLDEHGNALGGLRTPYLDMPVVTYYGQDDPADEASAFFCSLAGYKIPFGKEKIEALYPTRESYLNKVNAMVDSMVTKRCLIESDAKRIKKEAEGLALW